MISGDIAITLIFWISIWLCLKNYEKPKDESENEL